MRRLTLLASALFVFSGLFAQTYDAQTMAKMRAEKEAAIAMELQNPTKIQTPQNVSKDDILMHTGTVTTCSGTFYDSGGADGQYASNEDLTLTLVPATEGALMMVTFSEFNIENNYEKLYVYNGNSVDGELLATLTGATIPAEPFIGTANGGSLTFRFTSDGSLVKAGWKASVQCFTVLPNNLAAVSLLGTSFATAEVEKTMSITVKNWGTTAVTPTDYTVTLVDADANVLATANGVALANYEQASIDLVWTPAAAGTVVVHGVVNFAADEDSSNDQTNAMTITVHPVGTYISNIGTGTVALHMPFSFYYEHSLVQTMYYPSEIGIGGGLITALQYKANFNADYMDKTIKIWMGETEMENLASGWVDPASLTLVYDGTADFSTGINDFLVPLQTPYVYSGGNLVIYTNKADEAWSGSKTFYGTLYANSSRSRKAEQDNTPYDPTTPPTGTVDHNAPNIQIFISTEGMGALSGTVTSDGAPVEGAKVQIVGSPGITMTNAAGMYSFPYLMADIYSIEVSKHGFENSTVADITVVSDETTVANVTISPIMQYMVSGTVTASDSGLGVEGAEVMLEGYSNYTATTDATGHYEISGVYGGNTYDVTVNYEGYATYTSTVDVANDHITDLNIVVEEIAYAAKNVVAEVVGENVLVTWKNPSSVATGTPQMLMWDDGVNNDAIGTGSAAEFAVAHRYSPANLQELEVGGMSITKVTFYPNEAAATYTIRIWTGGTAAAPATLAYEQAVPTFTNAAMNEVVLTTPFEIDDTQELWIGYNINTTTGHPAGCDAGPQVEGFGNMMYWQGAWTTLSQVAASLTTNWNIHAWVDNAKGLDTKLSRIASNERAKTPKANLNYRKSRRFENMFRRASEFGNYPTIAQKSVENDSKVLVNYTAYRLLQGQEMADWTVVNANTTDTSIVDNTWATTAAGLYQYAVVVNYTNGVVSSPAFSNVLAKAMETAYTVNITTNSSDPATGAVVTLTNQDGNADHAYTMTAGATGATFPTVWKGTYDLTITKTGFTAYATNDLVIDNDGLSHTAQLIEIITAPYALEAIQDGANANFSWNNATGFSDDFESYEDFALDFGDYTQVDVDGSGTYSITNTTFPNQEYVGSFILFNPSMATPALVDDWAAYSGNKYLACFAATSALNNDWIITPEVTAADGMEFSFMAKSITDQYGMERFKVAVSTTGTAPADFEVISGSSYVEAPTTWTEYAYDLSSYEGQNIYIAIQCVSADAFVFMVDDLSVGMGKEASKSFAGYSVYKDGVEVETGITTTNYVFPDLTAGTTYEFGVKSVYTSGSSEIITIPYTHTTPVYTVTFSVKSTGGASIAGASVTIDGKTLVTNAQGIATIDLENGNYPYVITKTGYGVINSNVTVAGAPITVNAAMSGIEDAVATQNVVLYPNPVAEMLTIVRANNSNAVVEIYSNNGTMVKGFEMNEAQKEISVSELNSGVYFVRIIENQTSTVKRFIKN